MRFVVHWTTVKKYESSSVILVRHLTVLRADLRHKLKLLVFRALFLISLKIICPKEDTELFLQELFLIGYTSKLVFCKVLS